MKIQGWDLSLNHAGFVEIESDTGRVTWWRVYVSVKKHIARFGKANAIAMPRTWDKLRDPQQRSLDRLAWWAESYGEMLHARRPDLVVIEDYAFGSEGNKGYPTGEMGGAARLACREYRALQRWHDPGTLKMFVAHNGAAKMPEYIAAAKARWPGALRRQDGDAVDVNGDADSRGALVVACQADGDLMIALGLAHLGCFELMLREGRVTLGGQHPKIIQAFNRCTKARPISLLGRDWIRSREATDGSED